MNVLVICDDFWHSGEVIRRGLSPLDGERFKLDFVMCARDILTKRMIRDYDVIVNAKSNVISSANVNAWFENGVTAVMPNDFREYIEEGHGFIALHSGNCYTREKLPDMACITGNDFIGHPPQCDISMNIVADNQLTQGVRPFVIRDEHYRVDVHAKDAEVFLTSTSDTEAATQVAGYTRKIGNGRFCCLTNGHNCDVLLNPNFQKLMQNALIWCAGE